MKKLTFCFIFAALFVCLGGCKNESKYEKDSNTLTIELSNGNSSDLVSEPQTWHITNKRICVLFGYDFNTPEIIDQFTDMLSQKYGLDSDGGLIYPVIYPTDFKHGVKGYVNDLFTILQDDSKDFCGVILLGAPERTHTSLARNQDKWEQKVPYPVIALFPQDEVLGIEATCDVVLDKGQSADISNSLVEETVGQLIEEAPEVLIETINYILTLDGALTNDSTLKTHVSQMLKKQSIHHYIDPETGLQSINHFVLN